MSAQQQFTNAQLTAFGKQFVDNGVLTGYGYVRGGVTGRTTAKVKLVGAWVLLREAMKNLDVEAVVKIAKKLPSLEVNTQKRVGFSDFTVSYKGAMLMQADRV